MWEIAREILEYHSRKMNKRDPANLVFPSAYCCDPMGFGGNEC